MADYDGATSENVVQNIQLTVTSIYPDFPGTKNADLWEELAPVNGGALDKTDPGFAPVVTDWTAIEDDHYGLFFFERVWGKPQRIELGNIVSTVTREIEIYNSYREEDRNFSAATVNAGPGIIFLGLPALPTTIQQQSGVLFDVQVSTSGPPTIDGTLDFTIDTGTLQIPITGSRVVIFPYEPESPLLEILEFKTDVLQAYNGDEQRVSIRKHPRQLLQVTYRLLNPERRKFHSQMFSSQAGVVGVPIWFEARPLGADVTAPATVVTVDTTYGDFRAGSLAILWDNADTFEALEIDSLTATSITFTSALENNYKAGETLVMPLRVARGTSTAEGSKYLKDMDEYRFRFTVLDNEADIGDTSAYNSFNSKVLLDDPNWIGSSDRLKDSITTKLFLLDNQTASLFQTTGWDVAQYQSTKGFISNNPQKLWEVRQLVHALRGSQISFYIPTFYEDMIVTAPLANGSDQMTIENIGYTSFVDGQDPFGAIQILKTDGTLINRTITLSEELDATTERLTLNTTWSEDILVSEIERVSYLRLTRIADDKVQIEHLYPGTARISMATLGVSQ